MGEIERIARILDHPSLYMGGASQQSKRKAGVIVKELAIEAQQAEIARLRGALIQCGRSCNAILADDVSTDFLMLVPAEVGARIQRLSDERDEARAALEGES